MSELPKAILSGLESHAFWCWAQGFVTIVGGWVGPVGVGFSLWLWFTAPVCETQIVKFLSYR